MKVKIEYTVNIDPQAWAREFRLEPGQVREDVKEYLRQSGLAQVATLGLDKEDEER